MADDFLATLSRALGCKLKNLTEDEVLAEIRRLRESACELDRHMLPFEVEHLEVSEVKPVPGGLGKRHVSLMVVTKAGVYEEKSQSQGGPWTERLIEQPTRYLYLLMPEAGARAAHAILDEAVTGWDLDG